MGDVEILIAGAAALAPPGRAEKAAFTLLLDGLGYHQLEADDLAQLAADLTNGQAPGFGELLFEPRGDDRIVVKFLSDKVDCLTMPLIDAIERLSKPGQIEPLDSPSERACGRRRRPCRAAGESFI